MKFLIALELYALVFVVNGGVSTNNPFYCYSTDPIRPLVQMHSTRTSYEAVRRTSVNPTVSACTPSRFWFLTRHGGRLPHAADLEQMIDFANSTIQADIARNYDAGRATLCRQDFELIRDWVRDPNMTVDFASLLTEAGWTAVNNIARRYQASFPTVLPNTFSADRFFFRHTETARTNATLRAFADGLFGEVAARSVVFQDVPTRDTLLRPIDFCPAFRDEVANQVEQEAFAAGPEVEEMIDQVNRRLGFHGANQMSLDRILLMWEWCRFETASNFELSNSTIGEASPWCAPFSIAHHAVLEYHQDLGYYHFTGYGVRNQRLIENLNCGLMQDLLSLIASNSTNDQTVRISSAPSQVLQAFLVTLGVFRDEIHLNQHNFAQQSNRHWKISLLTPSAANLAVIRYDCADGDNDVVLLMNERPILVPGCDRETGVCKSSFLLNRFQRFVGANCENLFCSSN